MNWTLLSINFYIRVPWALGAQHSLISLSSRGTRMYFNHFDHTFPRNSYCYVSRLGFAILALRTQSDIKIKIIYQLLPPSIVLINLNCMFCTFLEFLVLNPANTFEIHNSMSLLIDVMLEYSVQIFLLCGKICHLTLTRMKSYFRTQNQLLIRKITNNFFSFQKPKNPERLSRSSSYQHDMKHVQPQFFLSRMILLNW